MAWLRAKETPGGGAAPPPLRRTLRPDRSVCHMERVVPAGSTLARQLEVGMVEESDLVNLWPRGKPMGLTSFVLSF